VEQSAPSGFEAGVERRRDRLLKRGVIGIGAGLAPLQVEPDRHDRAKMQPVPGPSGISSCERASTASTASVCHWKRRGSGRERAQYPDHVCGIPLACELPHRGPVRSALTSMTSISGSLSYPVPGAALAPARGGLPATRRQ